MSARLPDVRLPTVYVYSDVELPDYSKFSQILLSVLYEEYHEQCVLLIDRRNPMLSQYLDRFANEEIYKVESIVNDEPLVGRADMIIAVTSASNDAVRERLRYFKANGVRTVVILH